MVAPLYVPSAYLPVRTITHSLIPIIRHDEPFERASVCRGPFPASQLRVLVSADIVGLPPALLLPESNQGHPWNYGAVLAPSLYVQCSPSHASGALTGPRSHQTVTLTTGFGKCVHERFVSSRLTQGTLLAGLRISWIWSRVSPLRLTLAGSSTDDSESWVGGRHV